MNELNRWCARKLDLPRQFFGGYASNLVRILAFACAVAGLAASGCGGEVDPGDSSTHFWQSCSEDAQCGSSYECLCGRCSQACGDEFDCKAAGAQCVSATSLADCAAPQMLCAEQGPASDPDVGSDETSPAAAETSTEADASAPPMSEATATVATAEGTDAGEVTGPLVVVGADPGRPPTSPNLGQPPMATSSEPTDIEPSAANDAGVTMAPPKPKPDRESATGRQPSKAVPRVWSDIELVESSDISAWGVHATMDLAGNTIAVWGEQTTKDGVLLGSIGASRYSYATGWSPDETLFETEAFAGSPCVSGNADGAAVAVWFDDGGTKAQLWADVYSVSEGWTGAVPVGLELQNPGGVDCVMDSEGNATLAWEQYDGSHHALYTTRYLAAADWSTPELVTSASLDVGTVKLAVDAASNVLAVWTQLTETQQLQLWSRRYTAGAGWLEPVAMATTPGLTLPDFDLALSADGSGVAVWLEASLDDSDHAVWGSHFDATLGWDEAVKLEGGAERPSSLSVGIDASGNAIAAWEALTQMQTGYYNRILVSHYLTDEGWTGTTQLAEDAGYVTLAVSAEGSAVAAWREPYAVDGSSDGEIVAANFLPWLGWAEPLVFSAKPAGDAYRSALAINDYGQATLLWEQTAEPGQGDILASQLR